MQKSFRWTATLKKKKVLQPWSKRVKCLNLAETRSYVHEEMDVSCTWWSRKKKQCVIGTNPKQYEFLCLPAALLSHQHVSLEEPGLCSRHQALFETINSQLSNYWFPLLYSVALVVNKKLFYPSEMLSPLSFSSSLSARKSASPPCNTSRISALPW